MDDDSFRKTSQQPVKKNVRDDVRVWKSVGTGSSYGRQERSRSPRNFDDHFRSPPRSRSPKDFRERKQRYSEFYSEDYKRSFSKRRNTFAPHREPSPPRRQEPSPPRRRELSPNYYNNFRENIKYPHFSRKSDSRDRMDYISQRYERTNQEESLKRTSDNHKHQHQSRNQTSNQLRSFDSVLEATYYLSREECYKLIYERLKSLPEVKDINEMLCLVKVISEAQKKLKSKLSDKILTAVLSYQRLDTSSNTIPGLENILSSTLNNIYQAPPANSYQDTSTGSYPNQAPYQLPNASVPFASSSVQNFPHNMPGLNPADKVPEQGFNYSHYPNTSTSSAPKNFPHKY